MSGKTIFIIIATVLVTIILMNNTDEIDFWIFGTVKIQKLTVLGAMFATGFIVGALAVRPRRKTPPAKPETPASSEPEDLRSKLSDEDKDYIS